MNLEQLEQLNQELTQKLIELEKLREQLKVEKLLKKWKPNGKMMGGVDTSNYKDASYIYAPYQPLYFSPRP